MESQKNIEIKIEFDNILKSSKPEDENEESGLIIFSDTDIKEIKEEKRYSIFKNFKEKSDVEKSTILKLLSMKIPPYRISKALENYVVEIDDVNKIVTDIIHLIFNEEERNNQENEVESESNGSIFLKNLTIQIFKKSMAFLERVNSQLAQEKIEIEEEGEIECLICFEKRMVEPYTLKCNHKFCYECLRAYFSDKIKNGKIEDMPCPQDQCLSQIEDEELSKLVSEEMFAKYEYFKIRKELDKDPGIRWCIKPECGKYIKGKKGDTKIICECGQEICFTCSMPWHEGKSCDENNEDYFGEYASKVKVGNCPSCHSRIEKIDGCNHMTCSRCDYQFCWICFRKYTIKHYSRYNCFGCPGMLFGEYNRGPSCCKIFTIILSHIFYFIIFLPFFIILAIVFSLFSSVYIYNENEFRKKNQRQIKGIKYNKKLWYLKIFFMSILVFAIGIILSPLIFLILLAPGSCMFFHKITNH